MALERAISNFTSVRERIEALNERLPTDLAVKSFSVMRGHEKQFVLIGSCHSGEICFNDFIEEASVDLAKMRDELDLERIVVMSDEGAVDVATRCLQLKLF